jgi:TPR repeat protein
VLEILLFSLLIAMAVFALFTLLPDDRTRGFKALKNKEHKRAFEILKPYADKRRDGAAQAAIGLLYHTGKGVKPDSQKALKYYTKAYKEGQDALALLIGKMHLHGEGTKSDEKEAIQWLKKAAEKKSSEAMRLLGDAYSDAEGTLQDFTEAHRWYNLAAAAGDKAARTRLQRITAQMTPEQIRAAQVSAKPEAAAAAPEAAADPKG